MVGIFVLLLAGRQFAGATALLIGLVAGTLAASHGIYSAHRDIDAARAYEEDGTPLPQSITRKMDRWRRRHPGEHPPWEPPSHSL
jgi:hypothetical protein